MKFKEIRKSIEFLNSDRLATEGRLRDVKNSIEQAIQTDRVQLETRIRDLKIQIDQTI